MLRFRDAGLALLIVFLACGSLLAAEQAPPPPGATVVVTPGRAPQPISMSAESVTVITGQEITDSGIRTLEDVLRLVPGAFVQRNGDVGFPSFLRIRGTEANQVLVLVNGERVSIEGFALGTDLSRFTVEEITRIEVVRGSLSSLYGSSAIGGVVNIITDQTSPSPHGKAEFGAGNRGRQSRSVIAAGGGKLGYRVGVIAPEFDGRRPDSDYSATRYFADLIPSLGNWKVKVQAHHYQDTTGLARWVPIRGQSDTGGPGSNFWIYDPDDRADTERTRYSVSLGQSNPSGVGGLGIQAYHLEEEYDPELTNYSNFAYGTRIKADTDASDLNYNYSFGGHSLVFGGEIRREKFHAVDEGTSTSRTKRFTNKAVYLDDHWLIDNNTLLVAGVRFDDHSEAGHMYSPRVAIIRALPRGLRLRATYAKGFRAPGYLELYSESIGNPDLKTERSKQYEVALGMTRGNDTIEGVLFNYDTDDLVTLVYGYPSQYQNVARARQRGIEVSWLKQFTPEWSLLSSFTYLHAVNRTTDERLPGTPRELASLSARYGRGQWRAMLTGWLNKDVARSAGLKIPNQTVFDLSAVWVVSDLIQPYLTVRNFTNSAKIQRNKHFESLGIGVEFGLRSAW